MNAGENEDRPIEFADRFSVLAKAVGWECARAGTDIILKEAKGSRSVRVASAERPVGDATTPYALDLVPFGDDPVALERAIAVWHKAPAFIVSNRRARHIVAGCLIQTGTIIVDSRHVVLSEHLSSAASLEAFADYVRQANNRSRSEPFRGRLPRTRPFLKAGKGAAPYELTSAVVIDLVIPDAGLAKLRLPVARIEQGSTLRVTLGPAKGGSMRQTMISRRHIDRVGAAEVRLPRGVRAGEEYRLTVEPLSAPVTLFAGETSYPVTGSSIAPHRTVAFDLAYRTPLREHVAFIVSRSVELAKQGEFRRIVRAVAIRSVMFLRHGANTLLRR